jgi:maltose phosphorylase
MVNQIEHDGALLKIKPDFIADEKCVKEAFETKLIENQTTTICKYVVNLSSENHPKEEIEIKAVERLKKVVHKGFQQLLIAQTEAWAKKWENGDVIIEGDIAAQQAIRFNIFQLHQTYTGEDARLNIGPKGFTGEKYGGSTYWDTEAYCLPFYMCTAPPEVAKNLLIYRYKQLDKAIENAEKLGFSGGAALYPMVTMNGEEFHNECEIPLKKFIEMELSPLRSIITFAIQLMKNI